MRPLLALFASLLVLAAGPSLRAQDGELPQEIRKQLRGACYEVVVPKPEKDSIVYEKPLPWDLVPFQERNDKFHSIGTAFAISDHELVTAFHVLSPSSPSRSFQRFFIRDAQQRTWEVDQILAADEHRDVVRFSVKDKTFASWLQLRPDYEINETVFTIGNAYGEGILIRKGELVGSIPEPMDGAFQHLKISANVNSGNSGGPLVDLKGRVLGLVVQRRDNLAIALPAGEFQKLKAAAVFHNKVTYGFSLVPGHTIVRPRDMELPLPAPLAALRDKAQQGLKALYTKGMDELLGELAPEFYPVGKSSQEAMREMPNHTAPEVYFKASNTNLWALSDLDYKGQALPDGSQIAMAGTAGLSFLALRRSSHMTARELFEKPRTAMDLILQSVRVNRQVGSADTRILSYGEPLQVTRHVDRHGRVWWFAVWHQEFSDQVKLLYGTLTPEGIALVLKEDTWNELDQWNYDLPRILDLVSIGYKGTPRQWEEFLALPQALPAFLKEMTVARKDGGFALRSPWIQVDLPKALLVLDDEAKLHVNFGFEPGPGAPRPALRRLQLSWGEDEYLTLLKHLRVPDDSPEEKRKGWLKVVDQKAPYDHKQSLEDGHAVMARIHPAQSGKGDLRAAPAIYTVYLAQTQGPKEEELGRRLDALAAAFKPMDLVPAEPKAATAR
ncbi:MAG: trypsin-like peptidase domain-containing protein [Holophagaceae bacterium]|nr:trypsin-like peptidase domain-containing protein [Holophagaceae bacterium]